MNFNKIIAGVAFGFLLLCAYQLIVNIGMHEYGWAVVMGLCIGINIWTIRTNLRISKRNEMHKLSFR